MITIEINKLDDLENALETVLLANPKETFQLVPGGELRVTVKLKGKRTAMLFYQQFPQILSPASYHFQKHYHCRHRA